MDLKWEKARVGLKLAVQQINISIMNSEDDNDNELSIISVGGSTDDSDCYIINNEDDNFDKSRRITDAEKLVNECVTHKENEVEETIMKKRRLDNLQHFKNLMSIPKLFNSVTNSENEDKRKKTCKKSLLFDSDRPETYASTSSTFFKNVVDSGVGESCTGPKTIEVNANNTKLDSLKNLERNTEQKKNSESYDDEKESVESDNSTYFSAFEGNCYDPSFKLQAEDAQREKTICGRSLTKSMSMNSYTYKSCTFYFVQLFFEALIEQILSLEYLNTMDSNEFKQKEAVDYFLQLAESNNAEIVLQCKTEAVKSLQKVYERVLISMKSELLIKESHWSGAFSIFESLCDSKIICVEFIKFFTSHIITPNITTDLEDQEQILEGCAEYNAARFVLIQLHNTLRKYSKFVEERDSQLTIHTGSSPKDDSHIGRCIEPKKNKFDIELLRKFNEYTAKISNNFFELNYIMTRNIMLLKSRIYS